MESGDRFEAAARPGGIRCFSVQDPQVSVLDDDGDDETSLPRWAVAAGSVEFRGVWWVASSGIPVVIEQFVGGLEARSPRNGHGFQRRSKVDG